MSLNIIKSVLLVLHCIHVIVDASPTRTGNQNNSSALNSEQHVNFHPDSRTAHNFNDNYNRHFSTQTNLASSVHNISNDNRHLATQTNVPPEYGFGWMVRDEFSGNDFGHEQRTVGLNTQGSYYVLLPDGRRQRVNYYVTGNSGYVAEVIYEGEALYPPQNQPFLDAQEPQTPAQRFSLGYKPFISLGAFDPHSEFLPRHDTGIGEQLEEGQTTHNSFKPHANRQSPLELLLQSITKQQS